MHVCAYREKKKLNIIIIGIYLIKYCLYIHEFIHIYVHIYVCIYIYIKIHRALFYQCFTNEYSIYFKSGTTLKIFLKWYCI